MPDPEPWQTNAAAPFPTIEKPQGTVGVCALGHVRFHVTAPGDDAEVEGFDEACRSERRRLAARLTTGVQSRRSS